ncbi:TPA: hypothetical protein RV156_004285, partial [Yersinia enterocolitica]|nr:hypothetical protein [Yersinia enterocolitica]
NEIESIVIQKIMNTCCSLASQSDDSISFSAELVRQYSPEIINNRNKELAIEIRDARHFDLSLLSQETDYSAKKIMILKYSEISSLKSHQKKI